MCAALIVFLFAWCKRTAAATNKLFLIFLDFNFNEYYIEKYNTYKPNSTYKTHNSLVFNYINEIINAHTP